MHNVTTLDPSALTEIVGGTDFIPLGGDYAPPIEDLIALF